MTEALEGIKVLDLSRYAPGPFCTMILGDFGADIIKVEEAGALSGRRAEQMKGAVEIPVVREYSFPDSPYDPVNRNKRSLALNLKSEEGREIFYKLAEKARVGAQVINCAWSFPPCRRTSMKRPWSSRA